MSTYVPTAVALVDITLPGDGENIDAADVNSPLQEVADGVAHVQARTDVLADLTALAAILVPTDGLVRHVLGFGTYVFKTSATTGLSPFRVAAGDATAGGWKSSTAHETTLTRYVPASRVVAVTATAEAPSITSISWRPPAAAEVAYTGAGAFLVSVASTDVTNAWGFLIPIDEYLVDGATLSSATLKYCPDDSSAPTNFLQFTVIRSTRTGIVGTSAHLKASGFVADSGTYVSGTDKSVVYTCDQNNVIDLATYSYAVVMFDEHNASATTGNCIHHVAVAMTAILDARR